jgi:hypothetical protein
MKILKNPDFTASVALAFGAGIDHFIERIISGIDSTLSE